MADNGELTDYHKELAKRAHECFIKKDYDGTLKLLDQLHKQRENDASIQLNLAVTKFHQSGATKTEELKKALQNVAQAHNVVLDQSECVEESDNIALFYNHAVVLFHLRQYRKALSLADTLFNIVEPLDDPFGRQLTFLLADLHIHTSQPEKALHVLGELEKALSGKGDTQDASLDTLRARLSLYRARCGLLLRSMKLCKREMKQIPQLIGTTPQTMFLKAQFEAIREHPVKALKVLQEEARRAMDRAEAERINALRNNAMGCLHFMLRKHHIAANYFRIALVEDQRMTKRTVEEARAAGGRGLSGVRLPLVGRSRQHEVLYNLGIQLLHCNKPQAAFDCLLQSVRVYSANPRLWLRLAESCVAAHKQHNDVDRSLTERLKIVKGFVGSGMHRKLLLGTGVKSQARDDRSEPAMPMCTLEFASLCLKNALNLLPPERREMTPNEEEEMGPKAGDVLTPAPPSNPMRPSEVANLRCSVLAQSAYVALCLHDYVSALHFSDRLLAQPRLSGAHRYLGLMYRAEALVFMDRIADAIQNLNPEHITDVSPVPPEPSKSEDRDGESNDEAGTKSAGVATPWFPGNALRAKQLMAQNLAAAYAMRGELDKAYRTLMKSFTVVPNQGPITAQAFFLKIYLDLMEGRRSTAHNILKEHFGHAMSKQRH